MSGPDKVLHAVARGRKTIRSIAASARMSADAAGTYLTRLRDHGLIYRVPIAGARKKEGESSMHYYAFGSCALTDTWRGAP